MPRRPVVKKSKRQTAPRRGAFKSLRVSDGFRDFVLDQLSEVPHLLAKPMFGGLGLYTGDTFFGIVAADVLYLKVGDANRAKYERVGAAAFAPYAKGRASKTYYSVPVAVLEDSGTLARWVADAITVARQAG